MPSNNGNSKENKGLLCNCSKNELSGISLESEITKGYQFERPDTDMALSKSSNIKLLREVSEIAETAIEEGFQLPRQ